MYRLKSYKSLCILLMSLLVVNSTFALETTVHDAHEHEVHGIMSDMTPSESKLDSDSAASPDLDDCICDDICCVSSVQIGTINSDNSYTGPADSELPPGNLYQSIALDLDLPPPTA